MSSQLGLGTFDPNRYKNTENSSTNNRMAGDYLSEFTKQYSDNTKQNIDYNTSKNKKAPESNINKLLFSNAESFGPKGDQTPMDGTVKAQPVGDSKPVNSAQPGYMSNEAYLRNLKTIENYDGKDGSSNATGAQYNADLMSGINYRRAVKQNKKLEDQYATQESIKAGNDHGIHGESNYAPKSKEYYDYLNTYEGPKSYDQVVSQSKANTAGMTPEAIAAREKDLGQKGERAYDVWEKWQKDKMDYEAAWGSGQSVSSQKGWS